MKTAIEASFLLITTVFFFGYKYVQKWLVALFIWYLLGVNVWAIELSVRVLQRYVE